MNISSDLYSTSDPIYRGKYIKLAVDTQKAGSSKLGLLSTLGLNTLKTNVTFHIPLDIVPAMTDLATLIPASYWL